MKFMIQPNAPVKTAPIGLNDALVARWEDELHKAVRDADFDPIMTDQLCKSMLYNDEWYMYFAGSPYAAEAMQIEEQYLKACRGLDAARDKVSKKRSAKHDAINKKMDVLRGQRSKLWNETGAVDTKYSKAREDYYGAKKDLLIKLVTHKREQAQKRSMMKALGHKSEGVTMDRETLFKSVMDTDVGSLVKAAVGEIPAKPAAPAQPGNATSREEPAKLPKTKQPEEAEEPMAKALSTAHTGEPPGSIGTPSSSGTISAPATPSANQQFRNEPHTGMPAAHGEYTSVLFSEDDDEVESQITPTGPKALEQSSPQPAGAQLESSVQQRYGGFAEMNKAGQPCVQVVGNIVYSNLDDLAIAKAMNDKGYVVAEPMLGMPNSPVMSSCTCIMCKSRMPSYLSVCPTCSADQTGGANGMHGQVIMDEAVAKSLRPPPDAQLRLPDVMTEEHLIALGYGSSDK